MRARVCVAVAPPPLVPSWKTEQPLDWCINTGEQRGVMACTITVLRTCGLRDPDAVSQPLFEIANAPL